MSPATHFLFGWLVANADRRLARRERAAVALAGTVPDLDGLGAIAEVATRHGERPLLWFTDYHHALCHNLFFGLAVTVAAVALAKRRLRTGALALASFHLHLVCDVLGSRGPDGAQWPIPYLAPLSRAWSWSWQGQWALDAWPNFVITGALLAATLWLAWARGCSPVEIVSVRADGAVVDALRRRFGAPRRAPGA